MPRVRTAWLTLATLVVVALAPAAPAASLEVEVSVSVVADRLTYIDGTHRADFEIEGRCLPLSAAWELRSNDCADAPRAAGTLGSAHLGFEVHRSTESVPADIPRVRTSHIVAPEQLETVTVQTTRPGDLKVELVGRYTGLANPRAVPNSANRNGRTQGRRVIWNITGAKPDDYVFTARYRPRASGPDLGSFLPEVRVTLSRRADDVLHHLEGSLPASDAEETTRLVLRQHAAPHYGTPTFEPGPAYGAPAPDALQDEWVATPAFVANGTYQATATGRVAGAGSARLGKLAPGSVGALNTASMGTAYSVPRTGRKLFPILDFMFGKGSVLKGFRYGLVTGDPLGEFFLDVHPLNGTLHDGDSGQWGMSMSAGSARAREKRLPQNSTGRPQWDWDGVWAEGWSSTDEQEIPGIEPTATDPILMRETVPYVVAAGGDVDNREGRGPLKGPELVMPMPNSTFGFVGIGTSAPPEAKYRPVVGFTRDGDFFMRPQIGAGGYLLESSVNGYDRDWAIAHLLGMSLIGADPTPDSEQRRVFLFPEGLMSEITVATTTGLIERFHVAPGIWLLSMEAGRAPRVVPLRLF